MIEELYEFFAYIGIERKDLVVREEPQVTIVSFLQKLGRDSEMLVAIGIGAEDGRAEITVTKAKENADDYGTLKLLNRFNSEFSGMTFFAGSKAVTLRIMLDGEYEFRVLAAKLFSAIAVAKEAFLNV